MTSELDDESLNRIADRIVEKMAACSVTPRLMSLKMTAVYMDRTVGAVTHLYKRGLLPVTKIDGKIQVDREALDKLIRESTVYLVP